MTAKNALGIARVWLLLAVVPMVIAVFTRFSAWLTFTMGSLVIASTWIAASSVLKAIESRSGWMTEDEWIRKTTGR